MQVNLQDSLPNTSIETSATKPAECADRGSASSFSAHMGRILNPDKEGSHDQREDKRDDKTSAPICSDSQGASHGPCVISSGSTGTEPIPTQTAPASDSQSTQNGDAMAAAMLATTFVQIVNESVSRTMPSSEPATGTSSQAPGNTGTQNAVSTNQSVFSESNSVLVQYLKDLGVTGDGSKNASSGKSNGAAAASFKPTLLNSGSAAGAEQSGITENLKLPGNPDAEAGSLPAMAFEKLDGLLGSKLMREGAGDMKSLHNDLNAAVPLKTVQTKAIHQQPATDPAQAAIAAVRQGTNLRPEVASALQESYSADNSPASRNIRVAIDNSQISSSKKLESATGASSQDANTGNSDGDQNAGRSQSSSWTVLQSRGENSQPNSSLSKTAAAEAQPEFSSQLLSSNARIAESGSVKTSGNSPAAPGRPDDFLFQLAERIQFQIRDGKGQMHIQLKPDVLGRLEINAETAATGVIARITTESGSVKAYLENNLHILQQTLQENGLKVDRIYVVVQENYDSQSSSEYSSQSNHAGSGQSEEKSNAHSGEAGAGSLAANLQEELAIDPATWLALNPHIRFHTIA